jgi:type IV secretory pathway VirB2 component (pilin)
MTASQDRALIFCFFLLALCISTVLPLSAHAQELIEPLNNTLDFIVRFLQGPVAVSIGIVILISSVVAFALGRLAPPQLLQVVLVLAMYFGAGRIVELIKQVATR